MNQEHVLHQQAFLLQLPLQECEDVPGLALDVWVFGLKRC